MAYLSIRDALAARLETVTDAGKVHQRGRYKPAWTTFIALFTATIGGTKQVRGWWPERERVEVVDDEFGQTNWRHTFVIRGVLGVNDETDSDATFGALVEAALTALTGITIAGAWSVSPPALRAQDMRLFGEVLCHYCEIAIVVEEVRA